MEKLSLNFRSDLINLEAQREQLLQNLKNKRSDLLKINRDYQANNIRFAQINLTDADKLLHYKLLLETRGDNSKDEFTLKLVESRLKPQIGQAGPKRILHSPNLATRFSDPLKQARLEKVIYQDFLEKAEEYGKSACRSQEKRHISTEVSLKYDQNNVSPNRKISQITLGESFENSSITAAIGVVFGTVVGALGGFVRTLHWLDSLGLVRAANIIQADQQAVLALIVAGFGSVAGGGGGFLTSLIPAGLFCGN